MKIKIEDEKVIATTIMVCLVIMAIFAAVTGGRSLFQKEDRKLKIGFVYIGDAGNPYTANFIRAENQIREKFPEAEIETRNNVPESNCEPYIRSLAEAGCDLIFTTSFGYEDFVKKVAAEYPEIEFCHATGTKANADPLPNYHTFMGAIHEGRYLTGVVAGLKLAEMLQQGVISADQARIGYVAAFPYAEVISGYTAFLLGVRSIVPKAVMDVRYTNTWSEYKLEKVIAKEFIEDGCVIISQHSDTIGPAIACEESEEDHPVYHVGYNISMLDVAPTTELVSSTINWAPYMLQAVDAVKHGLPIERHLKAKVKGKDACGGLKEGWVELREINHMTMAKGTEGKLQFLIRDIEAGKLNIFSGNYVGRDPEDPTDTISLRTTYEECAEGSAPSFHYVLDDVIRVLDD